MNKGLLTLGALGAAGAYLWYKRSQSRSPEKVISHVAEGSITEIVLGRLATERSPSMAVREIGERMITDHSRLYNELKPLAASKGIELPREPNEKHRDLEQKLARLDGEEFDREYIQSLAKDHEMDVRILRDVAERGEDLGVRSFASRALSVIEEHRNIVHSVAERKGISTTTSDTMGRTMGELT